MGGKKGGGGHTPYEAPDSLKSAQRLRAIGLISLGPIRGAVTPDKYQSAFFDNTPLKNAQGEWNYQNTEINYNLGTQDQLPLAGFEMSEREVPVSAEVKFDHILSRSVIDPDVTRLRISIGVNALFEQNDQGDTNGTSVSLQFLINNRPVQDVTIDGKSSSRFHRSYILDNLPPVPFTITVKRLTADSKSQRLQNSTFWSSYTEIIDTKLSYPNMAMVGIKTDSRYNPNFPNINFLLYGRLVKVPSNYDPDTRTYAAGIWKGDFKLAWTNNPAWVFYDLVTNKLAGLGQRLGDYGVDKFQLYQIAQYCDQLVPDGYGGFEPRMTANLWITEQREAYQVISDMASVFRAIAVWNGVQFTAIQDRPSDPVCTYTQANVIEGKFNRQYAPLKSIFTAVEVEFADEKNFYQKTIEYVADDSMIERYGYNVKKMVAFACTSRGQARRYGKWVLETSRLEQCTINFSVGRDGLQIIPGDIIEVADKSYANLNLGGRVIAVSGRQVTLDAPIETEGESYLSYLSEDKRLVRRKISQIDRQNKALVTLDAEPVGLKPMDLWTLHTPLVSTQRYRVLTIAENDNGSYTITALQHVPQKEAIVDDGASFEPVNQTLHNTGIANIISANADYVENGVKLSWDMPSVFGTVKYQIRLYRNGKLYSTHLDLDSPEFTFENLPDGSYTAEIRAKGANGQLSDPVTRTFEINLTIPRFVTKSLLFAIELDWDLPKTATVGNYVELWRSATNNIGEAVKIATLPYPQNNYTINGVSLSESYYFWARCGDKNGHKGEFTEALFGEADHNPDTLLNALEGQITRSQLGESLINSLKSDIDEAVDEEAKLRQAAVSDTIAQIQSEAMARGNAITTLQNVDQQQAQQITAVTAKAENALSGISEEQRARAQGDKSNADKITAITARVGNAESAIVDIRTAKADKNEVATIAHTALQSQWQRDINSAKQSAISSAATDAQTKADRAKREAVTASERAAQAKADAAKAQAIASASNDATSKANAAKAQAIADAAAKDEAVKRQAAQDAQTKANAAKAQAIAEAQRLNQATSAKIDTVQRTLASADKANADSIKSITARVGTAEGLIRNLESSKASKTEVSSVAQRIVTAAMGETKAQISTVSNAVTTLTGKLQATHTIKTQTVAGGRKAIAGIALGTSSDGVTAESSVIVMADRFGIVANANDSNVKPVFSVANGQVGIRGDLVVAGSVTNDKLSTGAGGNLLYNPIFANIGNDGLPDGCSKWLSSGAHNFRSASGQLTDYWGLKSYLPSENQLVCSIDGTQGVSATVSMKIIPILASKWYMLSAYMGIHRANTRLTARCVKSDGSFQDFHSEIVDTRYSFGNGLGGGSVKRVAIKFLAPPDTISITPIFWILSNNNDANKHLRVARPMLEECTEYTREPSPWQNAGVTQVHGGSIIANTIRGEHIQANQTIRAPIIEGGSLNINDRFKVSDQGEVEMRSGTGNVGMVINNDNLIVYDQNGIIRVKIGKLR